MNTIQVIVPTGTLQTKVSSMVEDEDIACWIIRGDKVPSYPEGLSHTLSLSQGKGTQH